jgi:hypothetical protein
MAETCEPSAGWINSRQASRPTLRPVLPILTTRAGCIDEVVGVHAGKKLDLS